MFRVIERAIALEQIFEVYEYLHGFNPDTAEKVADASRSAGTGLNMFPERGRKVGRGEIREITTVIPDVIRYRVDGRNVLILRVRHAARRPLP